MYCKHCGKEISDDSKFCSDCGKSLIETPSKESNTNISNSTSEKYSYTKDENSNSGCGWFVLIICLLLIIVIGVSCSVMITYTSKDERNDFIKDVFMSFSTERKAVAADINLELSPAFTLNGNYGYTVELQANEKLINVVIEITFLSETGVIKTETLNVGKVTPGNLYKYEIILDNLSLSEIKELKRYKWKIIDGYVTK